ncbi:DUF1659 domain-containing protein [Anaerobacillus alkaliphilus]|uniref:DUF1659 domain-containing protein n=1 Tax=Anaerobacillus alkaliphilus TaxID=1548597 RepID=A0A4Q0VUP3_9BACI|nr:DUF1659 domain-containing protein [Anaerobacillus alkaliphilus]RXJ01637.1 DUF1659 domain-containing protein [Anaerobacillus alkaliphilus]
MSANILHSRLTLHLLAGYDEEGKEIFKTKNFSNINNTATDAQLRTTAEALLSLQVHTAQIVTRTNQYAVS